MKATNNLSGEAVHRITISESSIVSILALDCEDDIALAVFQNSLKMLQLKISMGTAKPAYYTKTDAEISDSLKEAAKSRPLPAQSKQTRLEQNRAEIALVDNDATMAELMKIAPSLNVTKPKDNLNEI